MTEECNLDNLDSEINQDFIVESRALDDLAQLISTIKFGGRKDKAVVEDELNIIKYALEKKFALEIVAKCLKENLKAQEKKLKAFEIIKTKEIDIRLFNDCPSLDEYNNWASDESQLTKKEYDLLREVLL